MSESGRSHRYIVSVHSFFALSWADGVVVTDLLDQQDKLVLKAFTLCLMSASSIGAGDVVVTAD
jgi:hypothetical protein